MEGNNAFKLTRLVSRFALWHGSVLLKATPQAGLRVRFTYTAPLARSVSVAGTFNDWTPGAFDLQKDPFGIWRGELRLKPGSYQYRFFIDGKWGNDPNATNTVSNGLGSKNVLLEVK